MQGRARTQDNEIVEFDLPLPNVLDMRRISMAHHDGNSMLDLVKNQAQGPGVASDVANIPKNVDRIERRKVMSEMSTIIKEEKAAEKEKLGQAAHKVDDRVDPEDEDEDHHVAAERSVPLADLLVDHEPGVSSSTSRYIDNDFFSNKRRGRQTEPNMGVAEKI